MASKHEYAMHVLSILYSNQMCQLKHCVRQCDGAAGWYQNGHEKRGLGMRLQHYNVVQGEYSQ